MKRQASFRIRKRDGRTEWLRSSKLARSIDRALTAAESVLDERATQVAFSVDDPGGGLVAERQEDWRAIDLATAVLTGLTRDGWQSDAVQTPPEWTTERLSEAVQRVLQATGYRAAATAYARASAQQCRRREVVQATMASAPAASVEPGVGASSVTGRLADCPPGPRSV